MKAFFYRCLFLLSVPFISVAETDSSSREIQIFSRDGVSFYVPIGWKLSSQKRSETLTIYSVANSQTGVFVFFRLPHPILMTSENFAAMSIEHRTQQILQVCECIVENHELELIRRHVHNGDLYGYRGMYSIERLTPPRLKTYQWQEFFHVDVGNDRVFVSANSEVNSLEEIELFSLFSSLTIL